MLSVRKTRRKTVAMSELNRREFLKEAVCLYGQGMLVGGLGAVGGCCIPQQKPKPNLVFGVVSDVHVRLAKDGMSLETGYDTDTLEKAFAWYRDQGADAVVIAGDMADKGLVRELRAVADTWFRVFPNDRATDGRKVERIFALGNHDAFGLENGKSIFTNADLLRREAIEADPAKAWDECFHEEYSPFFRKQVKGYDFFCSHWRPGVWCNGYAEKGCSGCGDAFVRLMSKCDPRRPFFYIQHPHPRDTVYGNGAWGVDDGEATKLLSAFPRAVSFSGHSHEPLTSEKAIWSDAFTSIATGSLRYLAASAVWNGVCASGYENGICNYYKRGVTRQMRPQYIAKYDAPKTMPVQLCRNDIRVGLMASVYDDRIELARREFVSGLPVGDDWIVELPAHKRTFATRASIAKPAEFPKGSLLVVTRTVATTRGMERRGDIEVPKEHVAALKLAFPAATVGGHVAEYEISAANEEGRQYKTRICAVGGLYPRVHKNFSRGETATIAVAMLPEGAQIVNVTPLDSFGNRGRSLSAPIPAAMGVDNLKA